MKGNTKARDAVKQRRAKEKQKNGDATPLKARTESFNLELMSPEERAAALEKRRQKERLEYVEKQCTRLNFILEGNEGIERKEFIVEDKPKSYFALQQAIANAIPNSRTIFMIYNLDNEVVKPNNFTPSPQFKVREVKARSIVPRDFPVVEPYWEYSVYHGRLPGAAEAIELKKEQDALRAAAKKDEDIRKLKLALLEKDNERKFLADSGFEGESESRASKASVASISSKI